MLSLYNQAYHGDEYDSILQAQAVRLDLPWREVQTFGSVPIDNPIDVSATDPIKQAMKEGAKVESPGWRPSHARSRPASPRAAGSEQPLESALLAAAGGSRQVQKSSSSRKGTSSQTGQPGISSGQAPRAQPRDLLRQSAARPISQSSKSANPSAPALPSSRSPQNESGGLSQVLQGALRQAPQEEAKSRMPAHTDAQDGIIHVEEAKAPSPARASGWAFPGIPSEAIMVFLQALTSIASFRSIAETGFPQASPSIRLNVRCSFGNALIILSFW